MVRAKPSETRESTHFAIGQRPVESPPTAARSEVSIQPCIRAKRGGHRNRADRKSAGLTALQIANLRDASVAAIDIGLPLNRFVTINWERGGVALNKMAAATCRFIDMLTKWLRRQGYRTAWIRVHENAHRTRGHCHLLVHVAPNCVPRLIGAQKRWLRTITGKPYQAGVIHSRPVGHRLGLEASNPKMYRANLDKAVGYICKGSLAPVASKWLQDGGLVVGKRCGTSQNIGAKARGSR